MYYRNTKMFIPEVSRRKNIAKQLYIVGNDDDDGTQYQLDIILLQRKYYHHKRMKYLFWVLFITGNVHTLFRGPIMEAVFVYRDPLFGRIICKI